jgi:hypothetical protein
MTKVGTKKPRGKPFVKGEDPRRVHGKSGAQVNEFTREMKRCLLDAAEQSGNRMVAISNERLPKRPNQHFSKELLALLRQDPQGMTSYFMWLAEHHPAIFVSLLGRALPQIMQHEQGADPIEAMIRTAEDIEAVFKARHIPLLLTEGVFKLPKRIDLRNPPVIDVTPTKRNGNGEQ